MKWNKFYPFPVFYKGQIQGIAGSGTPQKEYSESRKKKGGMPGEVRCVPEKGILEMSLLPTKYCRIK